MKYRPNTKEKARKTYESNKKRWRTKESYRWNNEYYDDYHKDDYNEDDYDDFDDFDDEEDYKEYLKEDDN